MSRAARCLGSSLRSFFIGHLAVVNCWYSARVYFRILFVWLTIEFAAVGSRHYGQQAVRQREQPPYERGPPKSYRSRESRPDDRNWEQHRQQPEDPDLEAKVSAAEEYMNRLFSPLRFPLELAQRVLTHGSHRLARKGHNAGLSFIGRRVLSAYLLLFLQASPNLMSTDDIEGIALSALHTNLLGEHVAHEWGVGRVLVWQPSIASGQSITDMEVLRSAGLYKVQGETIQAIVGAVYNQYGASVAHRLFHTRLLPCLLVKGGLPKQFHEEVETICERMGGREGPLLLEEAETPKVESLSS
ncbi:ribonuclease-III-like-domain-containing protein [Pholiota molesta]|nr:ribonuclease-III-like-domain-containing protein [Pholiota molesta]